MEAMPGDLNSTISVPVKLDAFVFNGPVCGGGASPDDARAKIAPITQPNYTSLRLHDALTQSDILPHVDIHNTFHNAFNSRLTNLDTGKVYRHRQGVYLHWMLPRVYRSGVAATGDASLDREKEGLLDPEVPSDDSAPQFRAIPNRWLVIRRLRKSDPAYGAVGLPEYEAWVIESDKQTTVRDVSAEVDLQVDLSPFVSAPVGEDVDINKQAEVFIGSKTRMSQWTEPGDERAPVTILNGGNVLFPDFQHHNGNVLSMLDNFKYGDGKTPQYLRSATVDYYVIGWHALADQDPFHMRVESTVTRSQRLASFQMYLSPESKDGAEWSRASDSGLTVCHGAMYEVEWDENERPKNIPADKLSKDLQDLSPISVGTTPMDSLLAYVKAQQKHETEEAVKNVMKAIENVQRYLLVEEDTVDGHDQADDLLYNFNFDKFPGGARYHIAGAADPRKPTVKPSNSVVDKLSRLNREQRRLDSLGRCEERLQWSLFSVWWWYVSRGLPSGAEEKEKMYQETRKLVGSITTAQDNIRKSRDVSLKEKKGLLKDEEIARLIENKVISLSVHPNFHTQQDPTLIVGHIQSAWPHDWLDALLVRVNTDLTAWERRQKLGDVRRDVGIDNLPEAIRETAAALVEEFIELSIDKDGRSPAPPGTLKPLYHDTDPINNTRRDDWGHTQPFFPLFLEWEAEYAHVDFAEWSLEERKFAGQASAKLSYGIATKEPLYEKGEWDPKVTPKSRQDIRVLSGRVLILPQASFSLSAQIKQLIDQTPKEELERMLKGMDPDILLRDLKKLTFLSSPLAGFHDNLLTMCHGTHIKPSVRHPGGKLQIIKGATSADAGLLDRHVIYMGTETDLTPYAALVHVSTDTDDSPFKAVTHGQFKLTKLNVIDKFGQVVHALDPRWEAPAQNIRPCLSEFCAPQSLPDNTPNIVERPRPGERGSHYAQMPPHINQMARVNSAFVTKTGSGEWVPQNEWDKPIWGWMVYNYLDRAIQFFLEDGTFYREVRVGGEAGAARSEKWLPFKNTDAVAGENSQLDRLINRMATSEEYLESMLGMIAGAMDHAAVAPDAYAQFLNSIVGRPLALANMAWSLELGTDEYANQSKINAKDPARRLLPRGGKKEPYKFPIKMGDKYRAYDGLVGYFETLPPNEQTTKSYLNLDKCYTFFGIKQGDPTLVEIKPAVYPKLQPFYVDPVTNDAISIEGKRNEMLGRQTFGAIVDPFRPVHGYTGILPVQPLRIPEWTWQEALSRMTAFFHFGPLNVTRDVPAFDRGFLLTKDTDVKDPRSVKTDAIRLPKMGTADWIWLQPYSEDLHGAGEETCFMPLGIAGAEAKPRFEDGPYTSVEGYLLLRQPLVRDA